MRREKVERHADEQGKEHHGRAVMLGEERRRSGDHTGEKNPAGMAFPAGFERGQHQFCLENGAGAASADPAGREIKSAGQSSDGRQRSDD